MAIHDSSKGAKFIIQNYIFGCATQLLLIARFISNNLHYAIGWSRNGLRILGVFPDPEKPLDEFRKPNMRFITSTGTLIYFMFIPQAANLIQSWGQLLPFVERIVVVNMALTATFKIIVTYYHRKVLRMLVASVYADWMNPKSTEARQRMLQIAGKLKEVVILACAAVTVVLSVHTCIHLRELIKTWDKPERHFIYLPYYPYDTRRTPTYEVTFIGQLSAGLLCSVVYFSIDSFVTNILLHVCGQLINLRYSVNELVAGALKNPEGFDAGLAQIIRRHEFLIGVVKQIDRCYTWPSLTQTAVTTLQICVLAFQVCTAITDRAAETSYAKLFFLICYVIVMMSHLFMYCYASDMLHDESIAMSHGAYDCNWYDLVPRNAKNLMMISYRSRIPLQFTIGKFGAFSLELYGSIIKTSMGYLSVLLTMKDKTS